MDTPANAAEKKSHWYLNWRFWLGAALSTIVVVWIVRAMDWRQVGRAISHARLGWVVLALVAVLLTILARALRWQGLLLPQHFRFMDLLTALLAGQVANYLVFSQLDFVVRSAILDGESKTYILGTVALEKFWDVLMLVGLVAVLSLGVDLPGWLILPVRLLAIGVVIATVCFVAILLFRDRLTFGIDRLSAFLDGLSGFAHPSRLIWGLIGSLMVWGLGAATNYCVLGAFDLVRSPKLTPSLLLLVALQAGVAVPSLPGNVGVFEAICVAVLTIFGVSQEQALAAGLVLHAIVFVPPLIWGGALMWRIRYRVLPLNRGEQL